MDARGGPAVGGRAGVTFRRDRRGADWAWARVCGGSRGPVWGEIREKGVLSKLVLEGQALEGRFLPELSAAMEVFHVFRAWDSKHLPRVATESLTCG